MLGKGGFGIVYAGVRNRDGLQVAIKHIAKAKIKDWGQVRKKESNIDASLISRLERAKNVGATRHPSRIHLKSIESTRCQSRIHSSQVCVCFQ